MKEEIMSSIKIVAVAILFTLIVGCPDIRIQNPLPEFRDVDGPTGGFSYLDFVNSTATVDLKGWTNAEIYFRFATSANAIKSINATELTNVCPQTGAIRNCTAIFPNAWIERQIVFPVGTTVFYQWFIDYKLPEGSDTATIESPLRSFSIVAPQSCVIGSNRPNQRCPAGQSCVRDFTRADPETTLAPTVCRIPEPIE
jgi:hypothetical protein